MRNQPTIFMGIFEVSRKECLGVIIANVNGFKNALINRMVSDYQDICTRCSKLMIYMHDALPSDSIFF